MTRKPTPTVLDEIFDPNVSRETLQLHYVPLGRVVDNPYQTRLKNVPDHVLGLASSLLQLTPTMPDTKGLQQVPIGRVVNYGDSTPAPAAAYSSAAQLRRLLADPAYVVELAFGHSRRLAFEVLAKGVGTVFPDLAGTEQVALKGAEFDPAFYADMPVILMPIADGEMWVQATTENAQRENISAIEEALAIKRATTELGMTLEQAGKAMNKSRSAASNLVRLLELPDQYQQAIFDGVMSEKHGRTMLMLKGAYHLFQATPGDVGAMSTRELETAVKAQIGRCKPIAPQGNTLYVITLDYGGPRSDRYSPPAWPLDWIGDGDPQIVGACDGCQWRITFNGDPGPRCTHKEPSGRSCYGAKDDRWEAMERAKQAAVAAARLATQQAPTQPAPTQIDDAVQPGAAASQPAPAANPAPQAKIADGDASVQWFVTGYSYGNAPAALLERGMCSQEKCECFVLAYNRWADEKNVRPDPVNAPNMCYGCTSKGRLQHRNQQLEHGDVKALRQAIKAENEACEELVRRAFYELPTGRPWWNNAVFLRDMVAASSDISRIGNRNGFPTADATQLADEIWMEVAGHKCRQWSQMTVDGNAQHWKMEKVQKWLRSLEIPAKLAMGVWVELAAGEAQPEPAEAAPIVVEVTETAEEFFLDALRTELAKASGDEIDRAADAVFLDALEAELAPAAPATPATTTNAVPADLAAHGWQLHGGIRGWQMIVTVDGELIKSRWYREPAGAIGDAQYMDRELKLGETVNANR